MKGLTFISILAAMLAACSPQVDTHVSPTVATFDRTKTDINIIRWINEHHAAGHDIVFSNPLDTAAMEFVMLALRLGEIDSDYVDAYHGPQKWRSEVMRFCLNRRKYSQISIVKTCARYGCSAGCCFRKSRPF